MTPFAEAHLARSCASVPLVAMRIGVSARLRLSSLVLLALIGTWLGHAVEYGLVAGWHGVALGLSGPVHSYMLPAGLLLVLATYIAGSRLAAVARAARLRAERLWRQLRRGVRITPAVALRANAEPHPFGLLFGIAAAQIGLYLLQENAEAVMAGTPAPGLGAITGAHWTASLVQLAFAAWLTLGWLLLTRRLRTPAEAAARIEAVLRAINRRRGHAELHPSAHPAAAAPSWEAAPRAARAPPSRAFA